MSSEQAVFRKKLSALELKANTGDRLPTIADRIDLFGLGPAQFFTVILAGGVWATWGAALLLISSVVQEVAVEFVLLPIQRGAIVTVLFVGVLFGNMLGGPYGDHYGRKQPIVVSYLGVFMFSVLSSYASSFNTLCVACLLLGMSFGIAQPASNALVSEWSPSRWRIVVATCTGFMFVVGEVYVCIFILADDPSMRHLHWRRLLFWGAMPALVMGFLAAAFLKESPSFLATQGRNDEARQVLEFMRDANNSLHDVCFEQPANIAAGDDGSWQNPFRCIFGPQLWGTTLVLMYSCFTLNFIFYGTIYAFPQVLPHFEAGGLPGVALLFGAFSELPASILSVVIGLHVARKPAIKVYLFGVGLALVSFMAGVQGGDQTRWRHIALMSGFYGVKIFVTLGFTIVYLYIAEIFPTPVRITGASVCFAAGRIAGMISPMAYELLFAWTDHVTAFFCSIAVLALLNFFLVDLLTYETFNVQLKDRLEKDNKRSSSEAACAAASGYGSTGDPNSASSA